MNNPPKPDYTSHVPRYTFANTLAEQQMQLAANPMLERFQQSRQRLASDPYRPLYHFVSPESGLLDYLADPFCFRHGDWYYAVATGKAECYSPTFEGPHVVPMVKSRDLRHWERVGRVLELPPEPFTCFWAPEIAVHDGRF